MKAENFHSLVERRLVLDQYRTSAFEHQPLEKVWLETDNWIQGQKLVKPYHESVGSLAAEGKDHTARGQKMEAYYLGHALGHFYCDVLRTAFGEI